MARRSAVDDGPAPASPGSPGAQGEPWDARPPKPAKGWSGGGGRWWIWVGRAVLWTFVVVVIVNGIRAPFERFTADTEPTGPVTPSSQDRFPVAEASAFAMQFSRVYLNYNGRESPQRQTELQTFIPDGADGQFGWNAVGDLAVDSLQVAGVEARGLNNGVVTVLAEVGSHWLRLAVPVYTKDGAMVVSGQPALLEPPKKAALPQASAVEHDTALEGQLKTQLVGFFQAYAASDKVFLSRFADPGITGLGAAVTYAALTDITAPKGAADERTVTANVTWTVPPTPPRVSTAGLLTQVYELVVVKKSDQWTVRSISGALPAGS
ncbi:MAG: conjugal transfer protein [Streptosporangiaceae bacterium]